MQMKVYRTVFAGRSWLFANSFVDYGTCAGRVPTTRRHFFPKCFRPKRVRKYRFQIAFGDRLSEAMGFERSSAGAVFSIAYVAGFAGHAERNAARSSWVLVLG